MPVEAYVFISFVSVMSTNEANKGNVSMLKYRPRVTACFCARHYCLRHSIPLALALSFTFKKKRMTVSCFVFGVQYVCRLTGKVKPEVKLFGVLGRRAEERHPG